MATERENIPTSNGLGALRVQAYDIAGNKIRAFYDASGQIIFIIDDTITPEKPNALLVINSDDDRKWDEILTKDYGVFPSPRTELFLFRWCELIRLLTVFIAIWFANKNLLATEMEMLRIRVTNRPTTLIWL